MCRVWAVSVADSRAWGTELLRVRPRERRVRSAGVPATEHAEDAGPDGLLDDPSGTAPAYFWRL
ncbi:hypothetical protein ARTHRO9V_210126 [Arthrobacter sp. 9V]|nr:hypothetical protein ARTHRO9V_210126 [Arthrobacter sp. 9V]